jgi:DNA ligase (NAD+)
MAHDITPEELLTHINENSTIHNINWMKSFLNALTRAGYVVRKDTPSPIVLDRRAMLDQMTKLAENIRYHCHLYHTANSPVITNAEFDDMVRELENLENQYGAAFPGSPTMSVGAHPDPSEPILAHAVRMKSLRNSYDETTTKAFLAKNEVLLRSHFSSQPHRVVDIAYVAEPKFDGVALGVSYHTGVLYQAATRGNGDIGEDVSFNARRIPGIPSQLNNNHSKLDITIFGEVVLLRAAFDRMNDECRAAGVKEYSTPRNAAAGMLRRKDLTDLEAADLRFVTYGYSSTMMNFSTHAAFLHWAYSERFNVSDGKIVRTIDEVQDVYNNMLVTRDKLLYEIDGMVVKLLDLDMVDIVNQQAATKRYPASALACKFPPDAARTAITDIVLQIGRTGVITPVAVIVPVKIGGVTVTRANLHSENFIVQKDIRIGDTVMVKRAADVIPEIDRVISHDETSVPWTMSTHCPCCNAPLAREADAIAYYCTNTWLNCDGQRSAGLEHFVSREAMNLKGIGPEFIRRLLDSGHVKDPSQFYGLDIRTLTADGLFGMEQARVIVLAANNSRDTTLTRFLIGLGIRHVGEITADDIARRYKTFDSVYQAVMTQEIRKLPGVGPETYQSLRDFLTNDDNLLTVDSLLESLRFPEQVAVTGYLSGRTIAFTGKFDEHNTNRQQLANAVLMAGGQVSERVNKGTSYLVVGASPSNKLEMARRHGVTTISVPHLYQLIQGQ